MRRSSAPSQFGNKRPRFVSPLRDVALKTENNQKTESNKNEYFGKSMVKTSEVKRSTSDILKLIHKTDGVNDVGRTCQKNENCPSHVSSLTDQLLGFNERSLSLDDAKACTTDEKSPSIQSNDGNDKVKSTSYFSVLWCKLSKKKHKSWEGDAVLIITGRNATLKDTEGKQIGSATGYKLKDLENLEDGRRLIVGSKEVEILGTIKENDYKKGTCFTSSNCEPEIESKPLQVFPQKLLKGKGQNTISFFTKSIYDPAKPGALVMPKPNASHQWNNNTEKSPIVDVIVEPKLTEKLRPHQKEGIIFLYECMMGLRDFQGNGAILADEMGLGKTLQCIALIWTALRQGPYGGKPILKKVLIITPSSLIKNWVKEFEKWLGKMRISLFSVDPKHKIQDYIKSNSPVMIISYEMFARHYESIEKLPFDLLICDESHRLKSISSKINTLLRSISIDKRILLTGTPIQNELQEFYSLVDICNPGILGSVSAFRRIYEEPITASQRMEATQEEKELGESRASELTRLTALFILRRTQDIINKYLPPKVENIVFCHPTQIQLSLMKEVLSCSGIRSCIQSSDGSMHLVYISILKKICNHPSLVINSSNNSLECDSNEQFLPKAIPSTVFQRKENISTSEELSGKLIVLSGLLAALHARSTEKVVVVSAYTQTLDLIQEFCKKKNYRHLRLDGSTSTNKRQSLVDDFNKEYSEYFLFLLSSKAGGVGLNLISASRIVLYDIDWNPANDLQAMSRIWRDGQKKKVYIYRLLTTGTIEEKIFQRQIVKQGLSGAIVDRHDNVNIQFTKKEIKDLFTLHENVSCQTHNLLKCTCLTEEGSDDVNLNVHERSTSDRSYQLDLRPTLDKSNTTSLIELLQWDHYQEPIDASSINDECLLAASKNISFLFQTTSYGDQL